MFATASIHQAATFEIRMFEPPRRQDAKILGGKAAVPSHPVDALGTLPRN
jgi:hypothetical protein